MRSSVRNPQVSTTAIIMSHEEEITSLKEQMAQMQDALERAAKREAAVLKELQAVKEASPVPKHNSKPEPSVEASPLYVTSRRLEKFRDRPRTTTDPNIHEWIGDMKAHLDSQRLSKSQKAAVVMEHLSGTARLEIQGRGPTVTTDPDEIFAVLSKVFGDGDSLAQLMSRFYAYQQKPGDDLLTTSIDLFSIYQRMIDLDRYLGDDKNRVLKDRLAEAVLDDGLKRELRRLNIEAPMLSYFEARDRAIHWLGNCRSDLPHPRKAVNQELPTAVDPLVQMLQEQQELMKSLSAEVKELKTNPSRSRGLNDQGQRVCFHCLQADHFIRDCPSKPKRDVRRWESRKTEIQELKEQVHTLQKALADVKTTTGSN